MIDLENLGKLIPQWESYHPFTLAGFQRLTRYQLLGKEIKQKAPLAACSGVAVKGIEEAVAILIERGNECNTLMRIDDINVSIKNLGDVQNVVGNYRFYHVSSWTGTREKAVLEKIEKEIDFTATTILSSHPKEITIPASDEAKVQDLNCQVVSLAIKKHVERANKILSAGIGKQAVLNGADLAELQELRETMVRALPWLNKSEERKEVVSLIKKIIAEQLLNLVPQNGAEDEIQILKKLSLSLDINPQKKSAE